MSDLTALREAVERLRRLAQDRGRVAGAVVYESEIRAVLDAAPSETEYAATTNPSMGVVMTPERLASLVEAEPCPTCSGPVRRTVGMVCQTCGKDYAPGEHTIEGDADDLPGMWERADFDGGKP